MRLDETSTRVIRAVRAEAARCGVDGKTLAIRALKRDPKYVYERFSFTRDFTTRDLGLIAAFLGITTQDIMRSAALDAKIHSSQPTAPAGEAE